MSSIIDFPNRILAVDCGHNSKTFPTAPGDRNFFFSFAILERVIESGSG